MSSISYIERNRGFITASKLKTFIKSPEAFYHEYIKETRIDTEESNSLILGTAFNEHLDNGPMKFLDLYFLDDGFTIDEMIEECEKKGIILEGKEKKPELMRLLYGNYEEKIRLTPAITVNLVGMLKEVSRQPLWDLGGNYEKQVRIEALYKDMPLRATLDRLCVEEKKLRDYKTCADLGKFMYELTTDKYGYRISMAFYFILVKMIRGVECDVYLDVVQSSGTYCSEVMIYSKEEMNECLADTIFPALNELNACMSDWLVNGDEAIWKKEPIVRSTLYKLDAYPILETAIQTLPTYI